MRGYARGETPNPCIRCNGGFRFAELLSFARRIGAAALATGHYARIVERDGRLLLARAVDEHKDQSYMLARLAPRHLSAHPLPARGADQGRDPRRGRRRGACGGASCREPGGVLPRGRRLPRRSSTARACPPRAGAIVDEAGERLGEHGGYWRFTPGQRRGLGIAAAEPLYALSTDPAHEHGGRRAAGVARPHPGLGAWAALRAGQPRDREAPLSLAGGARATVEETATGFRLQLDEPAYGVARGQAAVLYDGDAVVGSGLVTSAAAG